jgi:hypothetical protein
VPRLTILGYRPLWIFLGFLFVRHGSGIFVVVRSR